MNSGIVAIVQIESFFIELLRAPRKGLLLPAEGLISKLSLYWHYKTNKKENQ